MISVWNRILGFVGRSCFRLLGGSGQGLGKTEAIAYLYTGVLALQPSARPLESPVAAILWLQLQLPKASKLPNVGKSLETVGPI